MRYIQVAEYLRRCYGTRWIRLSLCYRKRCMGKFLGFCFFLCGVAAVYMWGVRPLTSESTTVNTPAISVVARASSTPALLSGDQRAVAGVVNAFLIAWRAGQYSPMYDELT